MENIKQTVLSILKKYTFNESVWVGYNDSFNIVKDLNINSARVVDIILDIEDVYQISIKDEDLDKLTTVKEMIDYIAKHVNN